MRPARLSHMVALLCLVDLLVHGQAVSARDELDAYYSQFSKKVAITGSFIGHGGMLGHPTASVFSVKRGGASYMSEANRITVSNGQSVWTYSTIRDEYTQNDWPSEFYGLLFGPRFAPGKAPALHAMKVEHKTEDGREVQIFELGDETSAGTRLVVDAKTRLPLEVRFYGNQGMSRTEVAEVYLHDSISETLFRWRPPASAKLVEFLKGDRSF